MSLIRAVTERGVAMYGDGPVELDLSADEESDLLARGHVELVPRRYRALSRRILTPQGQEFEAVYVVDREAALIAGGHIERVESESPSTPASSKRAAPKES
jgi:hypothetical protein